MTTSCEPISPAQERFQTATYLLLTAMGYAPRKTWVAGEFLFVSFYDEAKAQAALTTFQHVRWALEVELRHDEQGPYLMMRY